MVKPVTLANAGQSILCIIPKNSNIIRGIEAKRDVLSPNFQYLGRGLTNRYVFALFEAQHQHRLPSLYGFIVTLPIGNRTVCVNSWDWYFEYQTIRK